ncbi:adenylate kinase 8 isoform X11 [Syngnathoides biaculeatus]|uniref:adenylate kinase 8 isoform X11 n=1 Tax=Syngnathoides biaculeatus TaxID=300417 RepID=UPI002ADE6484|nr:adenylate kinase 8 isoform X11 [Syngnathoides biaculeatus]
MHRGGKSDIANSKSEGVRRLPPRPARGPDHGGRRSTPEGPPSDVHLRRPAQRHPSGPDYGVRPGRGPARRSHRVPSASAAGEQRARSQGGPAGSSRGGEDHPGQEAVRRSGSRSRHHGNATGRPIAARRTGAPVRARATGGSRRSSGGPDPRETQTGRLLQHVAVRRVVDVCVACFRAGFSTDFLKLACRLGISSRAASFPNTAAGRRRRRSFGAATWPAAGHAHRRYAAHAPVRAVTSLPVSATSSRAPEDAYRETSARPRDDAAEGRASDLQRHRCEVTGMSAAYRHVLKTVDGDQPPTDVYQQVVAFLRTRRCSRTPRVLLLGPPGSGKKHQAKMLSDKYKMVDVCCCDLLRWAEADPSWIGEEVRTYLQHNRPVPNGVTLNVLQERLNRADCSQRGWILHHLPCDLQHAKHLKRSLNAPNRVFFLELTDAVCLHRTAAKRTPTDPGVDAATVRECDDNARTVAHALGVYRTHTAGLQGVFPDGVHVDADQDPRYVFEALDRQLTVQTHTH